MLFDDRYFSIESPSEGLFKDRGSKFLSFAYPIEKEEDIKAHLQQLRKLHSAARHHCYAFRLGADKSIFRANDDGEPGNTAGKPILGQIQSKDLTNVLVVVVRYFGGTLLGAGGLINAYKLAAADALNAARIVEKTVNEVYRVEFSYEAMNEVMKLVKHESLSLSAKQFEAPCFIEFSIRKQEGGRIYELFRKLKHVSITFLRNS